MAERSPAFPLRLVLLKSYFRGHFGLRLRRITFGPANTCILRMLIGGWYSSGEQMSLVIIVRTRPELNEIVLCVLQQNPLFRCLTARDEEMVVMTACGIVAGWLCWDAGYKNPRSQVWPQDCQPVSVAFVGEASKLDFDHQAMLFDESSETVSTILCHSVESRSLLYQPTVPRNTAKDRTQPTVLYAS